MSEQTGFLIGPWQPSGQATDYLSSWCLSNTSKTYPLQGPFLFFFVVLSLGICGELQMQNPLRKKALDGFDFPTVHELSNREQISGEKILPRFEPRVAE